MSKGLLVDAIERQPRGMGRTDAERAVDAVFDALSDVVSRGDRVTIRGFGSFQMKDRKGRVGRNPGTGEPINIPAKRQMSFKPASDGK